MTDRPPRPQIPGIDTSSMIWDDRIGWCHFQAASGIPSVPQAEDKQGLFMSDYTCAPETNEDWLRRLFGTGPKEDDR